MKFKTMQEIETRKAQILAEMEQEGADLTALKAEMDELRANADEIRNAAAAAAETRKQIAAGAAGIGTTLESRQAETRAAGVDEIRASAAYAEAFKKYIITNDGTELRALLTTNAPENGQYPVPVVVDSIIATAWESNDVLKRINKTYIRGNLKVPFELEADPAQVHDEGDTAITEEDLTLGIVELKPVNIKKFIRISDEIIAMGGEAFVRYIYDELTQRVIEQLEKQLLDAIANAPAASTASAIGIPQITEAPGITTIGNALAELTEHARDVVVIINRKTSALFNQARAAAAFAMDPYEGLTVLYSSNLPDYTSAAAGKVYAIVGDLRAAHVNYPEGDNVATKWDDLSEAESDMVKVHGRQYAGYGVTRPGMICNVKKPS